MKTQRAKTRSARRRKTPKTARGDASSTARLKQKVAQLVHQLKESHEQLAATSEVLRVISSSPGELRRAFDAMLENATRICEAKFGVLYRAEGDALRAVALHGAPPAYAAERRRSPVVRPDPPNHARTGRNKEAAGSNS